MKSLQKRFVLLAAFVVVLGTGLPLVQAELLPITNASFETPVLDEGGMENYNPGDLGFGLHNGWNYQAGFRVYVTNPASNNPLVTGGAADGDNHVGCFYTDTLAGPVLLSQTLTSTFEAGKTYTLSVSVGSYIMGDYAGYEIGLGTASGFVAGMADNSYSLGSNWTDVKTVGASPAAGNWGNVTLEYTAPMSGGPVGQAIVITLGGGKASGTGAYRIGFDAVALDVVPEPCALVLLGTGLFVLLAYAWRRRKQP